MGKSSVAFFGERDGANRGKVGIHDGSLLHKPLAAQVHEIVLHAGGISVVGEFGEITGGNDAKLSDLGEGVQLGIAQLVGPVAIQIVRAASPGEDPLNPLLTRERWAVAARGSAGIPVTLVGPFLLIADSF
jgi:hypothetical protein